MPSKFDDYINNLPKDQQDKLQDLGKTLDDKSNEPPKEVESDTVENDYQEREGTQLDKNVYGNEPTPEYRPMNDDVKAQADAALETPEEASEEPKQGVEADYPSSAEKGEDAAETIGGGASDGVGSMEEEER